MTMQAADPVDLEQRREGGGAVVFALPAFLLQRFLLFLSPNKGVGGGGGLNERT